MYWKCHGNLIKPFSFQTSLSMKKTLLGIFTILISIKLLAQEPAIYHVVYDCEAKTSVGNATLYRWSLDIGKTTAVFYDDNYRKFHEGLANSNVKNDPISALDLMDALAQKYPNKNSLQILLGSPQSGEYTYLNTILSSDLKYVESMPQIAWRLSDSAKNISGYECRQAQGALYGRTWIVWYTPDVPLSYGPYLLGGLPGLILSAYDTEGCFRFTLAGLEKANDNDVVSLVINKNVQKCTRKRYLQMRAETNGLSQRQIVSRVLSQGGDDLDAGSVLITDDKGSGISDQELPKKNFFDKE